MGMANLFSLLLLLILKCCLADITIIERSMETKDGAFKVLRQHQKTSQKTHILLRFRTIHATGLIMFAQGANKLDSVSLELYRGKVRVAGNFGNGPKNRLRPISGLFEMNLGKDLADNAWHTVEFIVNIREMFLFIDRGTKNEKKGFLQQPQTFHELSISLVTFGGFYSFEPAEMSKSKSKARKGLSACFTQAIFSQTYPATQYDWLNFITDEVAIEEKVTDLHVPRIRTIPEGTTLKECEIMDPPYKPLFFPSSAVHIALVQNYTLPYLKVELMFRTVISDQTLANYTARDGSKIQFRLDRKGRISLVVDIKQNTIVLETAKEKYHDGEWHQTMFEVDNEKKEENKYLIAFGVDQKIRYSPVSHYFAFNGWVHVGFGYTGCMRDIKINGFDIDKVPVEENKEEFFTISDVGVEYNSCSLKDYCNPNPCQHGSKCNQTEDNIVCDCRETLYDGSTCHRARFNYTCSGVRKSGERRSDVYYIDFDGMGPMEPVKALCELGRTVETTTTQINNTKYLDIDVRDNSGKNSLTLNYNAGITQMRELIMNSAHCKQYIKYTCKGAPLFRSPEGPPATWWMGGDDINHYYWGGALNQRGYCRCGVHQTCRNNQKYCNCDDLDAFNMVNDEGNFTIKEHLPVRKITFTAVLKTTGRIQAIVRVGHLRCTGFGSRLVSATFRKPWSFLSVIHPDQPFDGIDAGGISFDFKTSVAYHYMTLAHARGPFSGDYIKIMIWSRTLIRILFNAGFGVIKQDVDIAPIGRTFDDNQWHEFNLMFNMKELNVTLDGVRMIQGLPLQNDPFEFTTDSKPLYIGGSYHDKFGFVGCIRSLYVNGRIFDLRTLARGQEDFGVYPGCGSACPLLNQPCNYGYCIDEFDYFKCNCSVSPNDGKYCGNETYPQKFTTGQKLIYDLEKGNVSEVLSVAIMVVGFKTTEENVALAQLVGLNGRHFSLSLEGGYLRLDYNEKKKNIHRKGSPRYKRNEVLGINTIKLNTNDHNIARVIISTEEVFLSVPNLYIEVGANVTESFIDVNNKNKGTKIDRFGRPIKFIVGTLEDVDEAFTPKYINYVGCMSGAKLVYNPAATATNAYRKSYEIDMFKLDAEQQIDGGTGKDPNPTGGASPSTERCGPTYKLPGVLPTVGPSRQFHTISPGLDDSVRVETADGTQQAVLLILAFLLAVIVLGILYLIYRYTSLNYTKYQHKKVDKYGKVRPIYVPVASSSVPAKHAPPTPEPSGSVYAESKRSTPASHRVGPGSTHDSARLIETDNEREEFL